MDPRQYLPRFTAPKRMTSVKHIDKKTKSLSRQSLKLRLIKENY